VAKKSRQGQKQCPKCNAWISGTRTKICPKCTYQFNGKPKASPAPEAAPATAEKPTKNGGTVTLEQVKAVAQTVKVIGGFDRLNELLGLVREVGGLRKMKELIGAMSVPETDKTPF